MKNSKTLVVITAVIILVAFLALFNLHQKPRQRQKLPPQMIAA